MIIVYDEFWFLKIFLSLFFAVVGKSKRKDYGKEEFDQIIQNVDKSISMDFVETISEMAMSNRPPKELQELFLHNQPIDQATLLNVGMYLSYMSHVQNEMQSLAQFF